MDESLLEFADSRGSTLSVDREAGVIRGVKILGLESRNGRTYLPEALAAACSLYEGAKVNVNHPAGNALAPREYQDRIGVIRNAAVRNDTATADAGLFGDLHFNPCHPLASQLEWDARHAPENVGLSHNVLAKTSKRAERVIVEAITKVVSVDLVADPATTQGLFEHTEPTTAATEIVQLREEVASLRKLVEDVTRTPPKSRDQQTVERRERTVGDAKGFVQAIRG